MAIVLRLLILAAIIIIIYAAAKYFFNPKRKLEAAHERRQFFFLDEKKNVRKNLFITYKGAMFEGEKYLGTTENAFEIVHVIVWPQRKERLKGLSTDDFKFIENEIQMAYPEAEVEWKSPVKELLEEHGNQSE
ncbi:hypothetical protein B0H94_109107 [Salsuginibacillus halophilus]|uniref:Sigma-w pathway protein ysdB n=1 Tax=Salsuginibacillus halophilus TaxID=517424 RepID=A0A2P8HCT4_9BACI|nr:sigma-w pathway protein ysdB [Salsuginibacillus halophilus]PSL44047.1 hypothetical protein B0H94_109107 [Salsuginibacillus halophilus]